MYTFANVRHDMQPKCNMHMLLTSLQLPQFIFPPVQKFLNAFKISSHSFRLKRNIKTSIQSNMNFLSFRIE